MTCSFDAKEYALGEASVEDARRMESHLADCAACRDEIARLRLTQNALLAVRDEEPPRRIAFVSDKVFEPRWYNRLWNSAPKLGFLAAAMLTSAILVHSFARPTIVPARAAQSSNTVVAAVDPQLVERAVAKAVAESEARQQRRTIELLKAADQRYELDRRATIAAFSEQSRLLQKQVANMYVTSNNLRAGE